MRVDFFLGWGHPDAVSGVESQKLNTARGYNTFESAGCHKACETSALSLAWRFFLARSGRRQQSYVVPDPAAEGTTALRIDFRVIGTSESACHCPSG